MDRDNNFETILDDVKNVGELLKGYRKERKITQEELANFAGLSRIGIVKLENNESDVKLSTLIKVVSLLGFDLVLKKRTTR
ncbi:MAG: helix-turn-helix transcriptional regulator [Bacteriovoracaceae bacterium]|nr:helix-turn-helix transcriptional regulator [Bacteriovoracaceae bacterium]